MNQRIIAASKPLAVIGLAFALAGCNKTTTGTGGTAVTAPGATASADTLATVGGAPVTRADLNKLLEAQYGESVLPNLIDTQLLLQAGKAAGIDVSDADVAAELERQKKLEPQLTEALTKNPRLLDIVNPQVRRNLVVQRLLTKDVKAPTEAELQQFFNTYKTYYQEPAKVKIGTLLTSTKARADAMSRALKDKTKTFEQLVAEQAKAQDPIAGRSSAGDSLQPVDTLEQVFGPAEAKVIETLPKGATTAPRPIPIGTGAPIYVLFHVTDRVAPGAVDFNALKPVVEVDYKMAQVAQGVVKENPANPPFAETLKRTRASIAQQSQNPLAPAPSLRDVLTFILRQKQQELLVGLRAKGLVKIEDPAYTTVADQYKAAPTPVPSGAPGSAAPDANAAPATNAAPAPAGNAAMAPATNAAPATNPAPAPAGNAAMAPATDAAPATNPAPAPAANAAMANAAPAAP